MDDKQAIKARLEKAKEGRQLAKVKIDGCSICWMENPSEAVKRAAVRQNWQALAYVEDNFGGTDEETRFDAIKQDPLAIRYIENPSAGLQYEAVKREHRVILEIENPANGIDELAKKLKGVHNWYLEKTSPTTREFIKLVKLKNKSLVTGSK